MSCLFAQFPWQHQLIPNVKVLGKKLHERYFFSLGFASAAAAPQYINAPRTVVVDLYIAPSVGLFTGLHREVHQFT